MRRHLQRGLMEARESLDRLLSNEAALASIERAAEALIECVRTDHRIFACGNGGSMCDAMHFCEELTGRYRANRPAIAATAIGDPGHLTCVSNDFGYEHVFSRYLEAHGRRGDCLVAISTSGRSPNVLRACQEATRRGMVVIALTGRYDDDLAAVSGIYVCTEGTSGYADRVQELHIKVLHMWIEFMERALFPDLYQA